MVNPGGIQMKLNMIRITMLFSICVPLAWTQVSVGGHAVFSLFSRTAGISEIIQDSTTSVRYTDSDFRGVSLLRFFPFLRWDVSEKISVDIRPFISIDGTSGASPVFGKRIGEQVPAKTKLKIDEFSRASVKAIVNENTEISAGYVHPRFTWEYGNDLFWEDVINGSRFSIDPWTSIVPDAGVEVMRNIEFGDVLSMPSYFYLISGSSNNPQQLTPMAMFHLEPDLGKLKFSLSGAGGLWDIHDKKAVMRASAGVSFSKGHLTLRMEGAGGWWQDHIANSPENAVAYGGYGKVIYRFTPIVRASFGTSILYHNFTNTYSPQPGEEVFASISPALQVFTSESSRIIFQLDLTNGVQNPWMYPGLSNVLAYAQGTIGWRLTF